MFQPCRGSSSGCRRSCPHGGDGVVLRCRGPDQAADGVAGEAQVLQGNFRRILHLVQVEAVSSARRRRPWRRPRPPLAWQPHFRPRRWRFCLARFPQNAGGGQGPENLLFGAAPDLLDIPQNRRQDAGGAAGGGGDDDVDHYDGGDECTFSFSYA